ncbi:MAG: DUF2786 domain-containing protein [Kiritimatiellae bacterium]|nr:DUF2786 domain-containing protein [Kiritimatiellia bacterium]
MNEKILSKIQKLLCLAADSPDSPESKLAAERAAELMTKYGVGVEDIQADGTMADGGIEEVAVASNSKHHQIWEAQLSGALCDCFDCKRILTTRGTDVALTFIGAKSDVKILVWFYKYLRLRIAKQAEHEYHLQKDQKIFGIGAVTSLAPRLKEMYKKKEEIILSSSRELVVNKQLAVNNFFSEKYKHLRSKSYNVGNGSRAAMIAGQSAGSAMSINQQVGA